MIINFTRKLKNLIGQIKNITNLIKIKIIIKIKIKNVLTQYKDKLNQMHQAPKHRTLILNHRVHKMNKILKRMKKKIILIYKLNNHINY